MLPKTQIKGATFVINNKPCIVITDFNKNYGTIWFSLIHELHHVLFDLDSIYDYDKELNNVLFSKTKKTFSDKMKDFWIKSNYKYFETINNPNEYNRDELVELLPKIKPYTKNVETGLITVFQALYNIGAVSYTHLTLPTTPYV